MSASFFHFGQGNVPDPAQSSSGFSLPADKMASSSAAPSSRAVMLIVVSLVMILVSLGLLWWTFVGKVTSRPALSPVEMERDLAPRQGAVNPGVAPVQQSASTTADSISPKQEHEILP